MKRIVIVGTSGCGKTTLATRLSKLLNIPCFDMDDFYWLPNWQKRDTNRFKEDVINILQQESWIISGDNSQLREFTINRCDTIIWLDYSIFICLIQAFKRSLRRIFTSEKCCGGNYENFSKTFFSTNSIFLWVIETYNKRKTTYNEVFQNLIVNKTYLRFSNRRDTENWILNISKL